MEDTKQEFLAADDAMDIDVSTDPQLTEINSVSQALSQSEETGLPHIQSNDNLKTNNFFAKVLEVYSIVQPIPNVAFITVNHMVSTLPPYLEALNKVGRIAAIIPKSSAQDLRYRSYAERKFKVSNATKELLADIKYAIQFIKDHIKDNEQFVVIDIGGYFAAVLPELAKDPWIAARLKLVVEDTENGEQKYRAIVAASTIPVISVARNPLKIAEDINVGKSIVRAADQVCRTNVNEILERSECIGVIGCGKIGSSIAQHLAQIFKKTILICDKDSVRSLHMSAQGFKQVSKKDIINKADFIFSATGNRALNKDDFQSLKDNVFIASVTSGDDELDLTALNEQAKESRTEGNITQYTLNNGNKINLIADGNAVNFLYGGVNGPFICAVQVSLIVAALLGAREQGFNKLQLGKINELGARDVKRIAGIWNNVFDDVVLEELSDIPQLELEAVKIETDEKHINSKKDDIFNVPRRSDYFVGRVEFQQKITNFFEVSEKTTPVQYGVLAGLGGLGKSELALYWTWKNRDNFAACIYIAAESLVTLNTSFREVADTLGIKDNEPEKMVAVVYAKLSKQGRSLIIFDDAMSKKEIVAYLPAENQGYSSANFAILITTRNQNQNNWPACKMLLMDVDDAAIKEDCVDYVEQHLKCSREEAIALAVAVHYLPLALSQLVGLILNDGCAIEECLVQLKDANSRRQVFASLNQEDREIELKRTVLTLWNLSIKILGERFPAAKRVMEQAAFLFADKIEYQLFSSNLFNFRRDIISALKSYSLIYTLPNNAFKIHRLLQEAIRNTLQEQQQQILYQELINLLVVYAQEYKRNNIAVVSAAYLHYQAMASHGAVIGGASELAKLLYALAAYIQDRLYDYQASIDFLEQADKLDHQDRDLFVKIRRLLAKAYYRTGKSDAAKKLYGALLDPQLPENIFYKVKLDYYLFLYDQKNYDGANKILDEVIKSSGVQEEDKARAYYYLAQSKIRYVRNLNKKIEKAEEELSQLETGKSKKRSDKEKYILSLKQKTEENTDSAIMWFKQSLSIKQAQNDHVEILRISLRLFEFVNDSRTIAMVDQIAQLTADLYLSDQGCLRCLDRDMFQQEFLTAGLKLALFFNNYPGSFESLNVTDKIKAILDEHKLWVENTFGKESVEYKELAKQFKQNQTVLEFQPDAGASSSAGINQAGAAATFSAGKTVKKTSDLMPQAKISSFFSTKANNSIVSPEVNPKKRTAPKDGETLQPKKAKSSDQGTAKVSSVSRASRASTAAGASADAAIAIDSDSDEEEIEKDSSSRMKKPSK